MFKPSPNPPEADRSSASTKSKTKKQDEAERRALDYYLLPQPEKSEDASKPDQLFTVSKNADNECLLANLSENLASADAMISNLAFDLEGPPSPHRPRHPATDRDEFIAGEPSAG